jgi:hypothetical protein
MKGTFFSADFVTDSNGNPRLIEINTDTGAVSSQMDVFDWSGFINVLNTNNITQVDVVYKIDAQQPIVDHLETTLAESASFITTFNKIVVPESSIFPTLPNENGTNFVLRMAYDETAILDSEYAKGTVNLLKLFADEGDSGSVVNFYHSSSLYGEYNTLDVNVFNGNNLPDVVTKTSIELHQAHKFRKIGHSHLSNEQRYADFINAVDSGDIVIEQYHIDQTQKDNNQVTSLRSFEIVYGSNLDICNVAQYEINAVFELPVSISFDDNEIDNIIESKHYYEFASNHIKNINEGLLDDELVVDVNGNSVAIGDLVIGNEYQAYHIEGLPNTDDYDVLDQYYISGSSLPTGSYLTSSICVSVAAIQTYANDMTEINFANGSRIVVGGQTRLLVYSPTTDKTQFIRASSLDTSYSIFNNQGEDELNDITSINILIFDEQQMVYTPSMEPVDNFILQSGDLISFFITHNLGSCFVAGTKILMGDGTEKNIEDVVEGDIVVSFNETTLQNESKEVIGLRQPVHSTMIKYHFANGGDVSCTYDHPIYVGGYNIASITPAVTNDRYDIPDKITRKIVAGDTVYLSDGTTSTIDSIEDLPMMDYQTYLITVADNHNFYANNILVHNK